MTATLVTKYIKLHRQGWLPIFVNDRLDAVALADICVRAGLQAIEITCRRPQVIDEIRQIREKYPELLILAGSVVDDSKLLPFMRTKRRDFPSIDQLVALGIDGLVAQLPFSGETLRAHCGRLLMIPGVESLSDAVSALHAGAHFVKISSSPPERIKRINSEATYKLFPVFYTGGLTLKSIKLYAQSGASVFGGGWDLMMSESYEQQQLRFDPAMAADKLERFVAAVQEARSERHADYKTLLLSDEATYLDSLTHFHPFATDR